MRKNLFSVIKARKDPESRKRLTKYYNNRGMKIKFHDQVEFEHTDSPSITYAQQLCPLGLIMYAKLFDVVLDKRLMFSTNMKKFADSIKLDKPEFNEDNLKDPLFEEIEDDLPTKDSLVNKLKALEDDLDKDSEDEPEKDDIEKSTDIPEDLKCPHCNATARTEKSYINNHGENCQRNIKTK